MEFKQTILQELWVLMRQEGLAHFSEEQLTARINISSATFREFFTGIDHLLAQVLEYDLTVRKQEHERLFQQESSPLKRLLLMVQVGFETLKMEQPTVLEEIMEKYPQVWATFWENSNQYNGQLVHEFLNEGVLQGELRKDINIQLVAKILIEQLSLTVDPEVFPPGKYNLSEVFRSIFLYYIRGLCTDKGMKIAEDFFASLK